MSEDTMEIEQAYATGYIKPTSPLKRQEGGAHYCEMKIQPIEYITANNLPFIEGNVVKYVSRHRTKNGAEDVRKAIHYLELLLETTYAGL